MTCEHAMITEIIKAHPDDTVEEVLDRLDEHNIRAVPVVDDNGCMVGMFCLNTVLENLLPVAVTMPDGLQRLNFVVGAAPGVAKRLYKLKPKKVSEIMDTDTLVVHPDTQTWEAIRLMVKYGSPIPVVEEESGKLLGLISEQSALADMNHIIKELEQEGVLPQ